MSHQLIFGVFGGLLLGLSGEERDLANEQ